MKKPTKIISLIKPAMEEAVRGMIRTTLKKGTLHERLGIADLGCSSGPNSLQLVSKIVDLIHSECIIMDRPIPELAVFLNDLPGNDFTNILRSLPEFYKNLKHAAKASDDPIPIGVFVSATAGSFYGRLFPRNSLHFVHSSSSLHWLSQVPLGLENGAVLNNGQVYITKSSPSQVVEAYTQQFRKDFSLFLRSRSEELVPTGRVLMSLLGRYSHKSPTDQEGSNQWELLARALMSMVADGLVQVEKVDSFNFPYYVPSIDELKDEVERQGSFYVLDQIEAFEVDWYEGVTEDETRGKRVARTIRAVVESMIESHFGGEVGDELFKRYAVIVDDHLSGNEFKFVNLVVSLVRKG
ncbi:Probable jasmonic acid carboxyl methyltransferase 2 [Linum perenne]